MGVGRMALEDYPFRVEELTERGEFVRVIAYLDHPIIARAAFRATVEQYPKARIRLRNRALVIEEHKPKWSGPSFWPGPVDPHCSGPGMLLRTAFTLTPT
jgi:hypothetical protein